jgi:hypothetical protein
VFAVGVGLFVVNFFRSLVAGPHAGENPWDAPTLEWSTESPPPPYNFAVIPEIGSRYPLWEGRDDRMGEAETPERSVITRGPALAEGREGLGTTPLDAEPQAVLTFPGDSLWPLLLALSVTLGFYALLGSAWWLAGVAALLVFVCITGWLWPRDVTEPIVEGER